MITEILSAHANSLHFKLSPAYTIYMMLRHFVESNRQQVLPTLTLVTDQLERTMEV